MIIGSFDQTSTGFVGTIRTLTITAELQFLPAERGRNGSTPDFRIFAGALEVGAAWVKQARDTGRSYLSVKLDDPSFPAPIFAGLFESETEGRHNLVWNRQEPR